MFRFLPQLRKSRRSAFVIAISFFLLYAVGCSIGDAFVKAADIGIIPSLTEYCYDDDCSKYPPLDVWIVTPSEPPPFVGKGLVPRTHAPSLLKKIYISAFLENRAPPLFS